MTKVLQKIEHESAVILERIFRTHNSIFVKKLEKSYHCDSHTIKTALRKTLEVLKKKFEHKAIHKLNTSEKDWFYQIAEGNLIIDLIIEGNSRAEEKIYSYRNEIIGYSKKQYRMDKATASDIFQDVAIAVIYNIKGKKLIKLDTYIKNYIYTVAINKLKDYVKAKNTQSRHLTVFKERQDAKIKEMEQKSEKMEMIDSINNAIKTMSPKCREILTLTYASMFSMEAIAYEMGLKSPNAAKTQKYKCMEKLRKRIQYR